MIEQRGAALKSIEVGAETQVENLPDVGTERRGFRLYESLDRSAAHILHDVHMVGRRADRQDGGESAVEQEPEPGRRELPLQGRALGFLDLLPVEGLDGAQVLQLRRPYLQAHAPSRSSERKY